MDKKVLERVFLDFFNVRTFITLGAFTIAYYLIIVGKEVPTFLIGLVNLLQGYWFGQKVNQIKQETKMEVKQ